MVNGASRCCCWDFHCKYGSVVVSPIGSAHGTAVQLYKLANDGEPKTQAAPVGRRVGLPKALKDVGQKRFINTRSVVDYRYLFKGPAPLEANPYLALL